MGQKSDRKSSRNFYFLRYLIMFLISHFFIIIFLRNIWLNQTILHSKYVCLFMCIYTWINWSIGKEAIWIEHCEFKSLVFFSLIIFYFILLLLLFLLNPRALINLAKILNGSFYLYYHETNPFSSWEACIILRKWLVMLGVIHLLFLHKPQLNKQIIKGARSTMACQWKKKWLMTWERIM